MWRETGSPLRFMGCDARILFPIGYLGFQGEEPG